MEIDSFYLKSRILDPQRLIRAYSKSAAILNLLRAFVIGGYAVMQRVNQWNHDFIENSEHGDRSIYGSRSLSLGICGKSVDVCSFALIVHEVMMQQINTIDMLQEAFEYVNFLQRQIQ
ncbi:phospho-2-dehydro-3-deoxyheptonate aldolase 1, chloroplastic-like protein, partial [Tanacetum coccineum]